MKRKKRSRGTPAILGINLYHYPGPTFAVYGINGIPLELYTVPMSDEEEKKPDKFMRLHVKRAIKKYGTRIIVLLEHPFGAKAKKKPWDKWWRKAFNGVERYIDVALDKGLIDVFYTEHPIRVSQWISRHAPSYFDFDERWIPDGVLRKTIKTRYPGFVASLDMKYGLSTQEAWVMALCTCYYGGVSQLPERKIKTKK